MRGMLLVLVVGSATLPSSRVRADDSEDEMGELEKAIAEDTEETAKSEEAVEEKAEEVTEAKKVVDEEAVEEEVAKQVAAPEKDFDVDNALEKAIEEPLPEVAEKTTPPPVPVKRPVVAETKPAPVPERKVAEETIKNQIGNLEFKMEGTTSRIVMTFNSHPTYREDRNSSLKQLVYYFDNTETPQRLQRAYDTTEFSSPVSLFTLLQMPGTSQSKLIVQMREDKLPTLIPGERSLTIEFPAPDLKMDPKIVLENQEKLDNQQTEENIYASGKTYTGKRIEKLEIKNSDIQDVLRLIAKTSGYNIVVGDDVAGKVGTLSLSNIPWDQAFALVLQSKKLGYIKQGNVLRVGTLASLKSEKEEALANEASRVKVEPLRTVLIPISYAKASDIMPRVKGFLTERGTVETDIRTNTVIVKDVDKVITKAQKLIAALDTQPPRVSIQAKIVEMLSSFTRTIGFDTTSFSPTFAGVNVSQEFSFAGAGGQSVTTISAPNLASFQSIFQIGESENKVKVLASPSVTSVANVAASVNQSISFFIPVNEVTGGVVITTLKQITANLLLDVTPIVAGDGSIFMTVNVRNEIPRGTGDQRVIDTRAVNTQVMIENGDTAVIGGIFNNTVNSTKEGVPFLMRIPILGFFFSRASVEDTRNEIFVFLTAKILNPEESFKRSF